jgi:hypothetical protein
MLTQILIGSILISATIVVEVIFIEFAVKRLSRIAPILLARHALRYRIILMTGATLWLLAALSIAIWIWAIALAALGVFNALEPGLYFSMVAFTTLGFGDIILPQEWRLLSGFIAANGLVLFGLNTAFLIEALRRILESNDEIDG